MTKKKWVYVAFLFGLGIGLGFNPVRQWTTFLMLKHELMASGTPPLARRQAANRLLEMDGGPELFAKSTDCGYYPGVEHASREASIAIIQAWGEHADIDQSMINTILSVNDPDEAVSREAAQVVAHLPIARMIQYIRGGIIMSDRQPVVKAKLEQILSNLDNEIHKPIPSRKPSTQEITPPTDDLL